MKNIFKVFRNYVEFVIFIILKSILGLFSFNFASNVGGILVGFFGKFTKYEKIIKKELHFVLARSLIQKVESSAFNL